MGSVTLNSSTPKAELSTPIKHRDVSCASVPLKRKKRVHPRMEVPQEVESESDESPSTKRLKTEDDCPSIKGNLSFLFEI